MANPFGALAAGYAKWRPPVHRLILEQAAVGPTRHALDIGCGSGISTRALEGIAEARIGIDPVESMVQCGPAVAPGADFAVGSAEAIPLRNSCVDLITAAGSLNYSEPRRFFREASRILRRSGIVLVYDFSTARVEPWFYEFVKRYPFPATEALTLDPDILAGMAEGFSLTRADRFSVRLQMSFDAYVNYMMTETNVAAAIRRGVAENQIFGWIIETLEPVWGEQDRTVLFQSYFACFTPDR